MIQRSYGTWKSAITPRMMASSNKLNDVQWSDDGRTLVWSERRDGKTRLVAQAEGQPTRDLTDASMKVGGGVGYGGGDFTLYGDRIYFCANALHHAAASWQTQIPDATIWQCGFAHCLGGWALGSVRSHLSR